MRKLSFLLFIVLGLLVASFACAQDVQQANQNINYTDENGNPLDSRCIFQDAEGIYYNEDYCKSLSFENKPRRWHEGLSIKADIGVFAGSQVLSTGYHPFKVGTRGFSGELDVGYHWKYVGVYTSIHFDPGTTLEEVERTIYHSGYEKYGVIEYGDWNRTVGGFGAYISFFAPESDPHIFNFDLGARFLFGKTTDGEHIHTQYSMYFGFGYQYLITDNFGLGFDLKIPGIISASTVKAFNHRKDGSVRINESVFFEATLAMSYTF